MSTADAQSAILLVNESNDQQKQRQKQQQPLRDIFKKCKSNIQGEKVVASDDAQGGADHLEAP